VEFARRVAEPLSGASGVVAVTLGGSRADGSNRPDSDYDLGLYYRGPLGVEALREAAAAAGYEGTLTEVGGWGGGLMNGGGWLRVEDRRVDLIYRDLAAVEHWWSQASHGRFVVERLPFYLCGIPSYTLLGELALSVPVAGELPDERPDFPDELRTAAAAFWSESARLQHEFVSAAYGPAQALEALGTLVRVALELAHARVAAKGRFVLNEKRLLDAAGLGHLRHALDATGDLVAAQAVARLAAELRSELDG
jgi:predicted nucleotidyltransferase